MTELLVIGYDTPEKAEEARDDLFRLSRNYLAEVGDAVVATADDKGRVRLNQIVTPWMVGATGGSFWGLLIGLLFLHPLLGVASGAAAGAVSGALSDFGIRDDFMKDVGRVLQPGQAALFILANKASSERVIEQLATHGGEVLRTNLSHADEERIKSAFANVQKAEAEAHAA
ncbi:hypothetical protein RGUI_0476 [Rhodovulum sp. P5]|uniref:DUF1269 domain-containing protein n=1 Tax=Rhodovulum sp. P5 TaxID=1564506 RepID=UPI0009C2382F|nr:DUF1269 domain-containing protein [Rhodovulum sp. P5]ARE38617.1 hypothetical protein RGUI_0476 [Rhodovulum sp. P5]